MSNSRMMGIGLAGARLTSTAFDAPGLGIGVFDDAYLADVGSNGADLRGTVFEGAILERTDLQPARLCNTPSQFMP